MRKNKGIYLKKKASGVNTTAYMPVKMNFFPANLIGISLGSTGFILDHNIFQGGDLNLPNFNFHFLPWHW